MKFICLYSYNLFLFCSCFVLFFVFWTKWTKWTVYQTLHNLTYTNDQYWLNLKVWLMKYMESYAFFVFYVIFSELWHENHSHNSQNCMDSQNPNHNFQKYTFSIWYNDIYFMNCIYWVKICASECFCNFIFSSKNLFYWMFPQVLST